MKRVSFPTADAGGVLIRCCLVRHLQCAFTDVLRTHRDASCAGRSSKTTALNFHVPNGSRLVTLVNALPIVGFVVYVELFLHIRVVLAGIVLCGAHDVRAASFVFPRTISHLKVAVVGEDVHGRSNNIRSSVRTRTSCGRRRSRMIRDASQEGVVLEMDPFRSSGSLRCLSQRLSSHKPARATAETDSVSRTCSAPQLPQNLPSATRAAPQRLQC
jgi:hypothetical protein